MRNHSAQDSSVARRGANTGSESTQPDSQIQQKLTDSVVPGLFRADGSRVRVPVAVALDARGTPTVVCDDGTVWFWGPDTDKVDRLSPPDRMSFDLGRLTVGHVWSRFHSPIPGSAMDPRAGGAE